MSVAEAVARGRPRIEPVTLVRPAGDGPCHAFTVDVEDWYQSCLDYDAPISERVLRNMERVLRVLDDARVKATFFVQGRVAETFPSLVAELVDAGHEVQAHGYSHRPLHAMSPPALRDELERAKAAVEDAAGTPVTAFRAQDFSVLERNLWALETMAEVGYEIDSSIFPMRSRHYGIAGWPLEPHRLVLGSGTSLLEIPVAVDVVGRMRVPVAGGGYLRLLPQRLVEAGLRSVAASRPVVVYCHPYEFNPDELAEYPNAPRAFRFAQGLGRGRFAERAAALLRALPFGRLADTVDRWRLA